MIWTTCVNKRLVVPQFTIEYVEKTYTIRYTIGRVTPSKVDDEEAHDASSVH